MIRIIPLITGVPIAASDGALGWSSVTYVQSENINLLVDTGFHGNRHLLLKAFKDNDLRIEEINFVFLTHLHFDHCQNIDLFKKATVVLNTAERDYVKNVDYSRVGDTFVADSIVDYVEAKSHIFFEKELYLDENLKLIHTPGHTPGSSTLLVDQGNNNITAICGDTFKYAWEVNLLPGVPSGTFGTVEQLKNSQKKVLEQTPKQFIFGHDRPFELENNKVRYNTSYDIEFNLFLNSNNSSSTKLKFTLPD